MHITCDWQKALWKCKHTPENNAALEVRTIQPPGCQLGQKLSFNTYPNTIKIKMSFQVNSLDGAPQYTSPSFYFPFRRKGSSFFCRMFIVQPGWQHPGDLLGHRYLCSPVACPVITTKSPSLWTMSLPVSAATSFSLGTMYRNALCGHYKQEKKKQRILLDLNWGDPNT